MSKFKRPRFSIVIPCYNEADFIGNTLESLKLQDTKETYEVIIVDNNCTDETARIAARYGVKVVTEPVAGICWARQAGTKAAQGEIIVSTDADTIFATNWLSIIDKKFRKNNRLVAVAGPCRYYNGPWWGKTYPYLLFSTVYAYSRVVGRPFYLTATNIAFKKSAWTGYDVTLMQGGDELDLLHKLRRVGKVQFVNSNPVYTSARRLTRGLLYNLLVTFLFYYMGAYYINRLFKRTVIGNAPAFRENRSFRNLPIFRNNFFPVAVLIFVATLAVTPVRNRVFAMSYDIAHTVKSEIKESL